MTDQISIYDWTKMFRVQISKVKTRNFCWPVQHQHLNRFILLTQDGISVANFDSRCSLFSRKYVDMSEGHFYIAHWLPFGPPRAKLPDTLYETNCSSSIIHSA